MADMLGTYDMAQAPLVKFFVDLFWIYCIASCIISCITIKPMEFEPIQPMMIADTWQGAVYIAQWLIGVKAVITWVPSA